MKNRCGNVSDGETTIDEFTEVSQTPVSFSINATVQPFSEAIRAADEPAGPPPTTITSKSNSSNYIT